MFRYFQTEHFAMVYDKDMGKLPCDTIISKSFKKVENIGLGSFRKQVLLKSLNNIIFSL